MLCCFSVERQKLPKLFAQAAHCHTNHHPIQWTGKNAISTIIVLKNRQHGLFKHQDILVCSPTPYTRKNQCTFITYSTATTSTLVFTDSLLKKHAHLCITEMICRTLEIIVCIPLNHEVRSEIQLYSHKDVTFITTFLCLIRNFDDDDATVFVLPIFGQRNTRICLIQNDNVAVC